MAKYNTVQDSQCWTGHNFQDLWSIEKYSASKEILYVQTLHPSKNNEGGTDTLCGALPGSQTLHISKKKKRNLAELFLGQSKKIA